MDLKRILRQQDLLPYLRFQRWSRAACSLKFWLCSQLLPESKMQPAAVSLLIVATAGALAPPRLFFDLKTTNAAALGRIEVELAAFDSLPRLVENLRLIAANERAPRCSFDGSRFRHAPQGPQYKWSHEFEGAGNRPAIEPSLLKANATPSCRIDVFCGSYYGYRWNDDDVLLTTPRVGPGAHKARFSFVRVKSSPPAWQERLLVNSYVLGVCAPGADQVLQRLCELPADAEPRIERAGLLDVADDCLVPAPEDARRRRPTSAVRRRRDRNTCLLYTSPSPRDRG